MRGAENRTEQEWACLRRSTGGADPGHAAKLATIISVTELKGYMLHLHKEGRLDEVARSDIQKRLTDLEGLYGRKLA